MLHSHVSCKGVLLVDDDSGIRMTLRIALEYEGFYVDTAENGQEALTKLHHGLRPCLILLDLMMPVMDGWTFLSSVEKDSRLAGIPVVLVTAFGDRVPVSRAENIIDKPIDLEKLLDTVRGFCGPAQAVG